METLSSTYVVFYLTENPKVISPSSFPQLLIFNGCCDSQWQLSNDHSSSCSIILLFIGNNQCSVRVDHILNDYNYFSMKKAICLFILNKNPSAKRMNGELLTIQEHKNYYCVFTTKLYFLYFPTKF